MTHETQGGSETPRPPDTPRGREAPRAPDTSRGREVPRAPDTRAEVDPDVAELLGLRPVDAGDVIGAEELDDMGEMTDTDIDAGELEAREPGSQPDEVTLESLADDEARAGETENPDVAAEEGLAWIPPSDPPVIPSDAPGGAEVAAGFGTTAEDEPFDVDHHGEALPSADERTARVEEALRADARTSTVADDLVVETEGDVVLLEGHVADMEDEDSAIAVAEEVAGVRDVVSHLVVDALEQTGPD